LKVRLELEENLAPAGARVWPRSGYALESGDTSLAGFGCPLRATACWDGKHYGYRLTLKGLQVALLFLFFDKRYGDSWPTAVSTNVPMPRVNPQQNSRPPMTRPTADIQEIVDLLAT
jgi:hypothetical protein